MDSIAEELERLARLNESGHLSNEEYATLKARLIATPTEETPPSGEKAKPPSPTTSGTHPGVRNVTKWAARIPALRLSSWLILAFNLLMAMTLVAALIDTASKACEGLRGSGLEACETATAIGASIGAGLILILWAAIDVILIVVWIATRREGRPEPGTVSRLIGLGIVVVAFALGVAALVDGGSTVGTSTSGATTSIYGDDTVYAQYLALGLSDGLVARIERLARAGNCVGLEMQYNTLANNQNENYGKFIRRVMTDHAGCKDPTRQVLYPLLLLSLLVASVAVWQFRKPRGRAPRAS